MEVRRQVRKPFGFDKVQQWKYSPAGSVCRPEMDGSCALLRTLGTQNLPNSMVTEMQTEKS